MGKQSMWSERKTSRIQQAIGEANAYRVWCAAEACDWECTIAELARDVELEPGAVGNILKRKGWNGRLRRWRSNLNPEVSDVCDLMDGAA